MIAGHYEYERQTGPTNTPHGPLLDEYSIAFIGCFILLIVFACFDLCCRSSQGAQGADESATNIDDDDNNDDDDPAVAFDFDTIDVPEEDSYATGTVNGENAPAGAEHLNIKVTDNNNEVFFKIKRSTKLEKLMNAFCERQGKTLQSVRFLFEGQRVQPTDTPDTLEMQDGDTLEVHQEQVGGYGTLY